MHRRKRKETGMTSSNGWGLIGTGRIAEERILPAINALAGTDELIAVVSRDPERAASFAGRFGARHAYTSYEEMLRNPAVTVVAIHTPNAFHAEQAIAAARAGKHVFCDKPLATCAVDAERMIAACEAAGVRLGVNFHNRFMPVFADCKRIIDAGAIGEVRLVQVEASPGARSGEHPRKRAVSAQRPGDLRHQGPDHGTRRDPQPLERSARGAHGRGTAGAHAVSGHQRPRGVRRRVQPGACAGTSADPVRPRRAAQRRAHRSDGAIGVGRRPRPACPVGRARRSAAAPFNPNRMLVRSSVLSQRFVADSVMIVVGVRRAKVAGSVPDAKETAARLDTWRGFPTKMAPIPTSFAQRISDSGHFVHRPRSMR
ncbi:MAG: gfo/Idh/MocA family oxidoreductase [Betaproteobacteria bacterium]|nr:MAG: gfo/Idh/MocA family oxidoreductase [Betaproteobacteria bacterium]